MTLSIGRTPSPNLREVFGSSDATSEKPAAKGLERSDVTSGALRPARLSEGGVGRASEERAEPRPATPSLLARFKLALSSCLSREPRSLDDVREPVLAIVNSPLLNLHGAKNKGDHAHWTKLVENDADGSGTKTALEALKKRVGERKEQIGERTKHARDLHGTSLDAPRADRREQRNHFNHVMRIDRNAERELTKLEAKLDDLTQKLNSLSSD